MSDVVKPKRKRLQSLLLFLTMLPLALINMDFAALATECAPWVAPATMAAIVKTESQFKPFAININGGAKLERQPATKEEAIITAKWLLNNNYNIDMGLGQVNSVNLKKTNLSVEDAFDPCKNLAASATILQWNYESASKTIPDQQAALKAAISAYNTGSLTRGFSNGYVNKVLNNARDSNQASLANQSEINPIALKNISNRSSSVENKADERGTQAVKLKATKLNDGQLIETIDAYKDQVSRQSVMVY